VTRSLICGLPGKERTVTATADWSLRFILFHAKCYPRELGAGEVGQFLDSIAQTDTDLAAKCPGVPLPRRGAEGAGVVSEVTIDDVSCQIIFASRRSAENVEKSEKNSISDLPRGHVKMVGCAG
jgi:hypothetical protein